MKADLFEEDMNMLYPLIREWKKKVPYKSGEKLNHSEYVRFKKAVKEHFKKMDKRSYWK